METGRTKSSAGSASGPVIRRAALGLSLAAAVLLLPGDTAGQEPDGAEGAEVEMPRAPLQFRVGPSLSTLSWEDDPTSGIVLEDVSPLGIDVESRIASLLGFRFGFTYGRLEIANADRRIDADQYILELSVAGRLDVGPFRRYGVIPFVQGGISSVIHDPVPSEIDTGGDEPTPLITKSQNAVSWGGGVDFDVLRHFGARVEWRRYRVELITVFDPQERSGRERDADRLMATLYWKL